MYWLNLVYINTDPETRAVIGGGGGVYSYICVMPD